MQAQSMTSVERDILTVIPIGMPVFDKLNRKVGDVDRVQVGISLADAPFSKPLEIRQAPEEFQRFLMQEGYIQIYSGFLWPERFAIPEQIESISYDGLYLNVPKDILLVL
jgi:hypothetical protein